MKIVRLSAESNGHQGMVRFKALSKLFKKRLYMFRMLALLGAVFAGVAALGFTTWSVYFIHAGTPTDGIIIDLVKTTGHGSDGTYWYPVFEYSNAAGKTFSKRSWTGSSPAEFSKGQRIPVLYLKANPETAIIATWKSLWGLPILLAIVTAFEIGLSILFGYLDRRYGNNDDLGVRR